MLDGRRVQIFSFEMLQFERFALIRDLQILNTDFVSNY